MTEQEQRKIKAGLIELGFWGADEPGDPTVDVYDAATLHDRLQAKLADGVFLVSTSAPGHSAVREVRIFHPGKTYKLAIALDYIEAICLAALALPEFLRRHPECAADQK